MGRTHVLETSLLVPRARRDVFEFFAEPENLEAITPRDLRFEILTPMPIVMCAGALVEYRLRLVGIQFGWLTRIEVFEPDERFVDVQVRGPYRRWEHTHVFEEVPQGTLVRDRVEYELPLGAVGELAHRLFVRPRLRRIFAHRARRISGCCGPERAHQPLGPEARGHRTEKIEPARHRAEQRRREVVMKRALLTGATGFVGARLHDPLRAAGWEVRCLTRRPDAARARWPRREWVGGDVGDSSAVANALRGCQCAMYLVHGLAGGSGFRQREVRAAETFARAAKRAGLRRVVFLGGVAPVGKPSEHLRARLETGEALREGAVPCLELRAGMIVGEGGASWTIVRDLAARLPAMVLPAWLAHRSEPVAVDDVIAALVAATRVALLGSTWWDLPGPEALSGKEILMRVAAVMGRRPTVIDVPVVTPWLSSQWIRFVTRADPALARELVEGLTSDLLATRPGFWDAANLGPRTRLEEAARKAIRAEWNMPWRSLAWEMAAALLTPRAGARA